MGWGTLIQAGMQAKGEGASAREKDKQRALLERILAEYGAIDIPDIPEVGAEQIDQLAPDDPLLRQQQMDALASLGDVASQGGATLADRSTQQNFLNEAGRRENAMRSRALDSMSNRGMAGSGMELASGLAGAQAAADSGNSNALALAGGAQKRALDAMMARGRMAGDVSEQDRRSAQARALINQYNASQRSRANEMNAGRGAQRFGMQMQKTGAKAGAMNGLGNYHGNNANDIRNSSAAYGAAAGKAADQLQQGFKDNNQDQEAKYGYDDEYWRNSPSKLRGD